ncbi:MAG: redoxin domain-containing protein [Planctomycetes bacterium]|nr:redoxin domain-containing protein [Planctomycetota bacterium]
MTEVTTTQVGHVVPDFEMETYLPSKKDFGKFSLAEAKKAGKWTVLVFYPADFTFVCATEFQALAEQYATLQKLGAEVLTVSTDTKFVHLAWQRHEGELANVTYPMAADPTGKVSKMFGVYMADAGVSLRGTFIIGPDGKLHGSEINFLNVGRNMEELTRKVQAFMHFSKLPEEACPANWKKPGDKSLKPNAALVGNVHQAMNG